MESSIKKIVCAGNTNHLSVALRVLSTVLFGLLLLSSGKSTYGQPAQAENLHEFDFSPHVEEESIENVRKADLLVEAIVQIESNGNPFSVGRAGERGLMQIKKATWREVTTWMFGRERSFDEAFAPDLNKRVGRAYLADLHIFIHKHRASWADNERNLLLACYNAGPNKVLESGFNIENLPTSNRDYVQRASALHDYYLAGKQQSPREQTVLLSQNTTKHLFSAPR